MTDVAIKVLLPALTASEEARARFREEGEMLLDLQHDGVVRVFDVGVDGERGVHFIAMRRLEGATLRARLDELRAAERFMGPEEAAAIADDLLEALAYAHARTVHRDVKPENVILEPDPRRGGRPRAVLVDFGVAKALDGERRTWTRVALGTVDYMAPEQVEDASGVDGRADLYAVAAVLYEALTGRPPRGRFKAPGALREGVPRALDAAVMRGLETAPADRHATAGAFREALAGAFARSRSGRLARPVAWQPSPSYRARHAAAPRLMPEDWIVKLVLAAVLLFGIVRGCAALAMRRDAARGFNSTYGHGRGR